MAGLTNPKLIPNWKEVLRCAWSIRLMLLAALLSGLEIILPFLGGLPVSPIWFAVFSFLVVAGAFIARLLAQSNMGGSQ